MLDLEAGPRASSAWLSERTARALEEFLADLDETCTARVPGTAVFLWSRLETTPPMLIHHLKHNKVLHETVVIFTIDTVHVPRVGAGERLEVIPLSRGFYRVVVHSGFMESPNVPALLRLAEGAGLPVDHTDTTYYLGRETFLATEKGRMGSWSEALFAFMSRNTPPATAYFNLPPERVVEVGMQLDL